MRPLLISLVAVVGVWLLAIAALVVAGHRSKARELVTLLRTWSCCSGAAPPRRAPTDRAVVIEHWRGQQGTLNAILGTER